MKITLLKLVYISFFSLIFTGCEGDWLKLLRGHDLNSDELVFLSGSELEPSVKINSNSPLRLSVINETGNSIKLSDKIEIVNLGTEDFSSSKQAKSIIVFSRCIQNNNKFIKETSVKPRSFVFDIINFIPEEILSENEGHPVSCSFFFNILSQSDNKYNLSLTQFPIYQHAEGFNVNIKTKDNLDLSELIQTDIDIENQNNFLLYFNENSSIKNLKIFCKDHEVIDMNLNVNWEESYQGIPIFSLMDQKIQKKEFDHLPNGIQTCRFVTENDLGYSGVTSFFNINFSSFKEKARSLDLSKINLTSSSSQVWEKYYEMLISRNIYNSLNKDASPVEFPEEKVEDLTITSVFFDHETTQKLLKERHLPVKVEVTTTCNNPANNTSILEETYEFLFKGYFSLMQVTPIEIFQMHYNHYFWQERWNPQNNPPPNNLNSFHQSHQKGKYPVLCHYKMKFENIKTKESRVINIMNNQIFWDQQGYGVSFSDTKLPGLDYISTIRRARKIEIALSFLANSFNIQFSVDNLNVDNLSFICKKTFRGQNTKMSYIPQTVYEKSLPVNSTSYSLPLSTFIKDRQFQDYIKKQQGAKCRILVYQKNILKYFSPELHVIKSYRYRFYKKKDKTDIRELEHDELKLF